MKKRMIVPRDCSANSAYGLCAILTRSNRAAFTAFHASTQRQTTPSKIHVERLKRVDLYPVNQLFNWKPQALQKFALITFKSPTNCYDLEMLSISTIQKMNGSDKTWFIHFYRFVLKTHFAKDVMESSWNNSVVSAWILISEAVFVAKIVRPSTIESFCI